MTTGWIFLCFCSHNLSRVPQGDPRTCTDARIQSRPGIKPAAGPGSAHWSSLGALPEPDRPLQAWAMWRDWRTGAGSRLGSTGFSGEHHNWQRCHEDHVVCTDPQDPAQ